MEKSIIIIGGGLTGLSAGCYGRMNGYRTSIYEMHNMAGGVATAWKRKGYIIDGAMNWLMGSKPGSACYTIWEELGAAPGWQIYDHELQLIMENTERRAFTVYCDADRFEQYLLETAPEDEKAIKELTGALRSVDLDFPVGKPDELTGIVDKIGAVRMLPFMNFMRKWGKVPIRDYMQRFQNPFLRESLLHVFGEEYPMVMWLMTLAMQHRKLAGYVIGGALALVEPIEKRYRDLGGELHLDSRVEKILVENDTAVGIRLADGSEHRADWIISAADGRTTIFDMLDGRYIDDKLRARYDNPNLFAPLVYVALGIDRSFDDVPPSINGFSYPLQKPIVIADEEKNRLNVLIYNFDPTLSPEGKNVAVVSFQTSYAYWKELHQNPESYKAEKERIADDVIAGLEQRFPGITSQVEMRDVATPVTWERYTGNWQGSYEGWMFSMDSLTSSMKQALPGLDNFYMAGQWVNPGGGMPTAAISGNHTIQLICHKDSRKFVTTKP